MYRRALGLEPFKVTIPPYFCLPLGIIVSFLPLLKTVVKIFLQRAGDQQSAVSNQQSEKGGRVGLRASHYHGGYKLLQTHFSVILNEVKDL
jgi:hypothetical protein